ncbi:MAG: hypothetical protein AAFZ52_12315 [Bacteroidota bacterium]
MRLALLLIVIFTGTLAAQEVIYPPDSLTTQAAIPRDAVYIPPGRKSGPSARLAYATYGNIRFPRSAMVKHTQGKVLVYGVISEEGAFVVDSAAFFRLPDARRAKKEMHLGTVSKFGSKKGKMILLDKPKKWSGSQKDLVMEAIRVANALPTFKPGTIDGRPVASYFTLPVVFKHEGQFRF